MQAVIVLSALALVAWWTGHHLPALAAALGVASLLWPPLPHRLAGLIASAAGTPQGSAAVLYAIVFGVPVGGLALLCGWRPRYRRFAQPSAARRVKAHAGTWVTRPQDQPLTDSQEN